RLDRRPPRGYLGADQHLAAHAAAEAKRTGQPAAVVPLADLARDTRPAAPQGGPEPEAISRLALLLGREIATERQRCQRAEVHNSYSVVGPDRKLYPTWHPPVDPVTGCSFGHDHGRDPRGSALYAEVGPIPFGYANEQLDVYDPANPRHEDHFGHKIEWEND